MRRAKLPFLPLLLLLLLLLPGAALAAGAGESDEAAGDATIEEGVTEWLNRVDWGGMEALLAALPAEVRALWQGLGAEQTAERIALGESFGADTNVWDVLASMFGGLLKSERRNLAGLFCSLVGISLIGAFANLLSGGKQESAGEAAAFVARCFTLAVLTTAFLSCAALAREAMDSLCAFIEAAAPILMALLTAMGCAAGVGVYQPALSLLSGGVALAMTRVVVPLALAAGVLGMFDRLSGRAALGEMSDLLKSGVKWAVGIVTTLYIGITSVQGLAAAAFDSVSIRTAKYAASSAAPMVGSLLSGAFDTVLGCAGLVKNAAGLTAILLCACLVAVPLFRLGAYIVLLHLSAALVQPVSDEKQVGLFRAGADMLAALFSACAAAGAMFIVTAGLITGLGNGGYWG